VLALESRAGELHHDGQTSSIKVKLASNQFDRTGQRAV
jgi:hypothetical protein